MKRFRKMGRGIMTLIFLSASVVCAAEEGGQGSGLDVPPGLDQGNGPPEDHGNRGVVPEPIAPPVSIPASDPGPGEGAPPIPDSPAPGSPTTPDAFRTAFPNSAPSAPTAAASRSTPHGQDFPNIPRYGAGSSIIFKPAEEVAEEKKTWGIDERAKGTTPRSTVQFVLIGTIVSVDKTKHSIVVRDKRQKARTLYVDPSAMGMLRKGMVVQTTLQPGNSQVESIQPIGK